MRQIGRYYVVEQLGAGAMGMVYRALDPTIGRTVAIKAIRLTDFADPAERERVRARLLQEARSAGLLSHPNIITIYDVLEEENSAFIVMEYVEGPSLGDMSRSGRLPDGAQLLRYFEQIADALDYAHRKGVIHRDIKSANILISSEHNHAGLAKISDFGISKFISQDTTHSGTMVGTPNYMAPEQIEGLPLDGRSDQFSFAVVVYEMLTGTKPFRAENLAALFYQVCKQEPPPAHELNTSLTPQVTEVIARGLAKDPAGRFGSCSEFISALSTALSSSGAWEPTLPNAEAEARTMATVAAAGSTTTDRNAFARPPVEPRAYEAPPATEAVPLTVPDRSPQPEFPALPRRTRLDAGAYDEEADTARSAALRRKAIQLLAVVAAVAALAFLLTRAFHREPSAPVVARSTGKGNVQKEATTGTAAAVPSEQRPPQAVSKRAGQQPVRSESQPNAPIAAAISSEVTITTQPPGARLVIDNRSEGACQTPCNTFLPPGRHTLTAELKGFDTARRIFTVPDEKQLMVAMSQSMGVLVVTTQPAGSTVIVDGKQYGVTPLNLRLPVGTHQLAIVNGAGRHEETVQIDSDEFTTRSFRWQ